MTPTQLQSELTKLRSERDLLAQQGKHTEALLINDRILRLKRATLAKAKS